MLSSCATASSLEKQLFMKKRIRKEKEIKSTAVKTFAEASVWIKVAPSQTKWGKGAKSLAVPKKPPKLQTLKIHSEKRRGV